MAIPAKLLLILIVALIATTKTKASQPNIINIKFYVQDVLTGPKATVVQVAQRLSNNSNSTGTNPAVFGNVFVYDNLLTVTPDPKSTVVGRFQGIAASSSLEESSLTVAGTVVFTTGSYNGSSFTVVGQNPYLNEVREIPVVGGTGLFRLVKGHVLITTYLLSPEKNVLRFNVTLTENQNKHE